MENIDINEEQIVDFLPVVFKKLEWMSKEDLITRFVSVEFNRFLTYYKDAGDINASLQRDRKKFDREKEGVDSNMTLLRINLGRMDKLTPPKLIGLVNDSTQTRNITIGKVRLNASFTIFEADKDAVALILKSFKNVVFDGRQVVVSPAGERERKSGNNERSGRDYGKRRSNDSDRKFYKGDDKERKRKKNRPRRP